MKLMRACDCPTVKCRHNPCERHSKKVLGYLNWFSWAERQIKKQTQCLDCGLWFFPDEMNFN